MPVCSQIESGLPAKRQTPSYAKQSTNPSPTHNLQLLESLPHILRTANSLQLRFREIHTRPIRSHCTDDFISVCFAFTQDPEAQSDFCDGDGDTDYDEHDDDPCDGCHLGVCYTITEDLGEFEEDTAALIEHFDARCDFHVLSKGDVEGVEGGFGIPEEIGDVEDVGCWFVLVDEGEWRVHGLT